MTTIAWDGKTLAADKLVSFGGLPRTVTKIFRVGSVLVGIAGNAAEGYDMIEWVRGGCKAEDFPASQRDKDSWVSCLLVSDRELALYERAPKPIVIEDGFFACGSGRDFAMAAMHIGKSAREAVEIASLFDISTGNGVDVLELSEQVRRIRA
jgi:ATP-dependent protease HslVU (ClpYQ) peptidase subunit